MSRIAYVNGETTDSGSMNEALNVNADDQTLYLTSMGMASFGSRGEKLSQEGAADLLSADVSESTTALAGDAKPDRRCALAARGARPGELADRDRCLAGGIATPPPVASASGGHRDRAWPAGLSTLPRSARLTIR